jgi:hypothetical protein
MKKVNSDQGPIDIQIIKKSTLSISLRCLSHPITFLSICLLLLNDHVFKHMAPSHLTGKLSDFAGLFFFPFLLATVISLPFDRTNIPPRNVARIAFAITAVWFTLIKTLPIANALMVNILEYLLGSAQIVRDPTDLIALVVLWPAWRHWRSIEQVASKQSVKKSAYIVLGLASLATLATSPCPGIPQVRRLAQYENIVYASGFGDYSSWDGTEWQYIDQIPSQVEAEFMQPMELPKVRCVPGDPRTCYRITNDEQVLVSKDGGENWEIFWRVPPGRREFMDRAEESPILSCSKFIDIGPYDMALVGSGASHELIVAMGTEGVLVKNRNGELLQQSVVDAIPTPFTGFDLSFIRLETSIAVILALITLSGLSTISWDRIQMRAGNKEPEDRGRRRDRSLLKSLLTLVYLTAALASFLADVLIGITFFIPIVIIPIGVIAIAQSWRRIASEVQEADLVKATATTAVLTSVGVFIGGLAPIALWTLGFPAFYWQAIGVSLLLAIVSLIWGVRRIKKHTE